MSRPKKLALLVIVLVAIIAAGWWALHAGDPTAFAKGKRVELADFKGPDPTGSPASLANADLVARGEYPAPRRFGRPSSGFDRLGFSDHFPGRISFHER